MLGASVVIMTAVVTSEYSILYFKYSVLYSEVSTAVIITAEAPRIHN